MSYDRKSRVRLLHANAAGWPRHLGCLALVVCLFGGHVGGGVELGQAASAEGKPGALPPTVQIT